MKITNLKIIACLLIVAILLAPQSNVFALSKFPSEELQIANDFLINVLDGDACEYYQYLKNVNNEIAYILFQNEHTGYVIIDIESKAVVEGAPHVHPYFTNRNAEYLYNGPLKYYQQRDGAVVDLSTLQEHKISTLSHTSPNCAQFSLSNESYNTKAEGDYTRRLSGTVRNLYMSSEPNTLCPAFAAAMFFLYYETYLYPGIGYVPPGYTGTGAVMFPDYLALGGWGLDGARNPEPMRQGMQNYLNWQGVNKTITCLAYTGTRYKNQINAGKPVIVGLDNDPEYGNHWVVGYGYYVKKDPNVSYLLANDGQGYTNVHINPAYVDYLIY